MTATIERDPGGFPVIPNELLEHATDQELHAYLRALRSLQREELKWELQPRQREVEERVMAEKVGESLYGGAAGPGKSELILWHHHNLAIKFPGYSGIIIRRTFPELRQLIRRSLARFDVTKARFYKSDKIWEFANGSYITFAHLENPDEDVHRYQGDEFDCVSVDELTHLPTDYAYTYLMSRLRTTIDKEAMGLFPHMFCASNPGHVGGAWVKARFVDLGPPDVVHTVVTDVMTETGMEEREMRRAFFPGKLSDNRYINARAYRSMLANLPEATRRALEEGSWDVVEGQFFTEFQRAVHVVKPFVVPEWWQRFRGYDFGSAKPCAWEFFAQDGDGNLYVYDELYAAGLTVREQAAQVLKIQGADDVRYTAADPSIWTNTGAGPPIAHQLSDAGVRGLVKANNARIDGWARVHDYLRLEDKVVDNPLGDGKIVVQKPSLYIFSTCTDLVRTLPMLVHDKHRPEDLDTDGEDHAADALRYGLMSRPGKSKQPKVESGRLEDRIVEHHRKKARRKGVMENTPVGTVHG